MTKIKFMIWVFLYLICMTSYSHANEDQPMDKRQDEAPGKLENFISQKGVIYVKDYYDLGSVDEDNDNKAEFQALICYKLNSEKEKLKGIWIRLSNCDDISFRKKVFHSNVSFIDLYEAEILSSILKKMVNIYNTTKNKNIDFSKVYKFDSDDNVGVALVHDGNDFTFNISNGGLQKITFRTKIEKMNEFISFLDKGIKLVSDK